MKTLFYFGLFSLMACPTAPENGPSSNAGQLPGPQGGPQGGSQGGPQNGPQGGPQGPGPGDAPGGEGAPPQGTADGPTPPEGSVTDNVQGSAVEDPNAGQGLVKNEGTVMNIVIRPQDPSQQAKFTQTALAEEDHVVFKGKIKSKSSDPLMIRAKQFLETNGIPGTEAILTEKSVKSGDFELLIPKGNDVIALEVIVDSNNDGLASKGESFAVLEKGADLKNNASQSGLDIDLTKGTAQSFTTMPVVEGPEKTPTDNTAGTKPADGPSQEGNPADGGQAPSPAPEAE